MSYFVYMLLCSDSSYYLGSTNDVSSGFLTRSGKSAKITLAVINQSW